MQGRRFERHPQLASQGMEGLFSLDGEAIRMPPDEILGFGRFLLLSKRRMLLADGKPVPIGGRTFDVLLALVEARGALVTKNDLLQRVWPNTFVEESNLRMQVATLRRALGPDRHFIQTDVGRGYRFVASTQSVSIMPEVAARPRNSLEPKEIAERIADFFCWLRSDIRVRATNVRHVTTPRPGLEIVLQLLSDEFTNLDTEPRA